MNKRHLSLALAFIMFIVMPSLTLATQFQRPLISSIPKTKVDPEESFTIYGKNFFYKKSGDNFNYSLLGEIYFVKSGLSIKAKGVSVRGNSGSGEDDQIQLKAPTDIGSYSLKITLKEGDPILWSETPIEVKKAGPPTPVLSRLSKTTLISEESFVIYGKDFAYQQGSDPFKYSSFKDIFFVKDGNEIKAKGVSSISNQQEEKINLNAPKEPGSYSIKLIAKSGETVLWNTPLIEVQKSAADLAKEKALEEELAKKKAEEELAKKKAEEALAKEKALEEEVAKKKAGEELAKQKALEEDMKKKADEARKIAEQKKYCDPELPKFWQPGCIERQKEDTTAVVVPTPSPDRQPTSQDPGTKPVQPGANICDPNIPHYSQPECVDH